MTNPTATVSTKRGPGSPLELALLDLKEGMSKHELWMFLSWRDIQKQYSRSLIGPFWLTISMGVMVAGMGLLYAVIFRIEVREYLPFLSVGLILWGFISNLLISSCAVYSSAAGTMRQVRLPLSVYIFQLVYNHLIIFGHNMIIYIAVALIFGIQPSLFTLLFFPAFALVLINGVFAAMILGPVCARFRDVPMIIASLIQLTFFVTPIIWNAEQLPERAMFVHFNPFFHFIEIVRAPLLGGSASVENWVVSIGITLVLGFISLAFFARYRSRVAYWV